MKKKVGIDIGATAVRVVEVSGVDKDGLAIVTAAAIEPLPSGAVSAGRVIDAAQVAHAIKAALRRAKVSRYGVIIGVASPKAALARVSMSGGITPAEWPNVLRLEERTISPAVPIGDSAVSVNLVTSRTSHTGVTTDHLLAAATLRTEVENLMTVCKLAGLTPRAVDLAAAAAFRGMVRVLDGNTDVSTLVDIGSGKVTVATRAGMHLRSVRTTDGGGEDITRALSGVLDCPWDEAEHLKLSGRVGATTPTAPTTSVAAALSTMYGSDTAPTAPEAGPSKVEASQAVAAESLTTSTEKLIDSIAAAIEEDRSQHPDDPTQVIQLCGSGALLQGLPELMTARLGLHTFIGRPWLRVNGGSRTADVHTAGAPDPAKVHSLVAATGLALWQEITR